MACALEEFGASGHPVGNAIFSSGVQQLGESWVEFKKFGSVCAANNPESGGLSGYVSLRGDDMTYHSIVLGSEKYLERQNVSCCPRQGLCDDEGTIFVHAAVDGIYAGTFSITVSQIITAMLLLWTLYVPNIAKDAIRAEAVTSIRKLRDMGYSCGMVNIKRDTPLLLHLSVLLTHPYQLTGDTGKAAARVSLSLKIPILASGATPADKLNHVNTIRGSGNVVTMVSNSFH